MTCVEVTVRTMVTRHVCTREVTVRGGDVMLGCLTITKLYDSMRKGGRIGKLEVPRGLDPLAPARCSGGSLGVGLTPIQFLPSRTLPPPGRR